MGGSHLVGTDRVNAEDHGKIDGDVVMVSTQGTAVSEGYKTTV
jgi:hypothetical protein